MKAALLVAVLAAAAAATANAQPFFPKSAIAETNQEPIVSDYVIKIGSAIGNDQEDKEDYTVTSELNVRAGYVIGNKHMPVLANGTTVAVNLDGNALAIATANARGKGGTATALSSAKAIALDQAAADARARANNWGGNTVGTTTLAFSTAIAKSLDGESREVSTFVPIARPDFANGVGLIGIVPNAIAKVESRATAQAGQTVAGTVGIASAGNGGAAVTGPFASRGPNTGTTDYAVSRAYGATGYFAPGIALSGQIGVATAQKGFASARQSSRAYGDVSASLSGQLNVATGETFATAQGSSESYADLGPSLAGMINIPTAVNGYAVSRTQPTQAVARVGPALAGTINIVSAYSNAYVGDYDAIDSDYDYEKTVAEVDAIGPAIAVAVNLANTRQGDANIAGQRGGVVTQAIGDQGPVSAVQVSEATGFQQAQINTVTTSTNTMGDSFGGSYNVGQSLEDVVNIGTVSANAVKGSAISQSLAAANVAEFGTVTSAATSTTTIGNAVADSFGTSIVGMTAQSTATSSSTTETGASVSRSTSLAGAALTGEAVATSSAASQSGGVGSLAVAASAGGIDAEADSAASASGVTGDALAGAWASGLAAVESAANSAAAAATSKGNAAALGGAVSTGGIRSHSSAKATATAGQGNAQTKTLAAASGFLDTRATTISGSTSEVGASTAAGTAIAAGVIKATAGSTATSATGGAGALSEAEANAIAVGFIADATASAGADAPENAGRSRANAIALGVVSRVSNGGNSTVALGPAQALSGGFAVAAPKGAVGAAAAATKQGAAAAAASQQQQKAAGSGAAAGDGSMLGGFLAALKGKAAVVNQKADAAVAATTKVAEAQLKAAIANNEKIAEAKAALLTKAAGEVLSAAEPVAAAAARKFGAKAAVAAQ